MICIYHRQCRLVHAQCVPFTCSAIRLHRCRSCARPAAAVSAGSHLPTCVLLLSCWSQQPYCWRCSRHPAPTQHMVPRYGVEVQQTRKQVVARGSMHVSTQTCPGFLRCHLAATRVASLGAKHREFIAACDTRGMRLLRRCGLRPQATGKTL